MNVISYSLFGYSEVTPKNCFEFNCYLRGLMINIRMNRLLYPNWKTHLVIDESTSKSEYRILIDELVAKGYLIIKIMPDNKPLCTKMLWRLLPIWDGYGRVLCRDLDSVATYREAQAVQEWIDEEHTIHCITDSISHNIPMMGGMIGFISDSFQNRTNNYKWEQIECYMENYDMTKKGADQKLLNDCIYPKICHSATEHFVKGMNWNKAEKDGRHYRIDEGYPMDLNADLKASNHVCGHIGSAGYYELELLKFLNQFDDKREEFNLIERKYTEIFHWAV